MAARKAKKKAERRSYHHGQLKEAILTESLKILSEKGAHGLSLRDIARELGVTPMAAYRHFADKESILATIAEQGFEELTRRLQDVWERVDFKDDSWNREFAWAYVGLAIERPEHLRLMFGGFIPNFDKYPSLKQKAETTFSTLVKSIELAQEAGSIRAGSPLPLAMACWSMVHGFAMLHCDKDLSHVEDLPKNPRIMSDALSSVLMDGLRPDRARK